MVLLRTGGVGEGKSYNSIRDALFHLRDGGVVATNFSLQDGWAFHAAGRHLVKDWFFPEAKTERAQSMWNRWFRIGTPDSISQLSKRLPDLVAGFQLKRYKKHKSQGRPALPEGLGLLILDEAHIYFNSHDYRENAPYRRFLSQSRKKGWNVIVIAHDVESIDSQIRKGLINQEEAMRNLTDLQPIPLLPVKLGHFTGMRPWFLGIRKLSGKGAGKGQIMSRSFSVLDTATSSLYETMEEFDHDYIPDTFERIGGPPALPVVSRHVPPSPAIRAALADINNGFTSKPLFTGD